MNPRRAPLVVLCTCLILTAAVGQERPIVVGSKNFTESYLLAEIMAQALEADGLTVERRFGFGGTKICYEALRVGEIVEKWVVDGHSDQSRRHPAAHPPGGLAGPTAATGMWRRPVAEKRRS